MSRFLSRRRALFHLGSLLAASPVLRAQQAGEIIGQSLGRIPPLNELINTLEFEAVAKRKLGPAAYAAIAGGNREGFDRILFRPRLMVNTENLDLTTELFADTMFAPILIGPASHQKRFHPEAELAMARGASAARAALVVADRCDAPIAKIAAEARGPLWYQAYPELDANGLLSRIRRAVEAGCKAVCITVGAPHWPVGAAHPRRTELPAMGHPALDWDYIDRIRLAVVVPLLLKGIMSPEEADAAVEKGIQGIIVSNHGGRFVHGVADPITVLPEIVDAVSGRVPVLVDGGFRRGSDVLKALVFGAEAVLISRPALWGLAAYGADGVRTVVELLQTELARDLAMLGAASPRSLNRDLVKIDRR